MYIYSTLNVQFKSVSMVMFDNYFNVSSCCEYIDLLKSKMVLNVDHREGISFNGVVIFELTYSVNKANEISIL